MEVITSYYLLELVFYDISGSIRQHRRSKKREHLYDYSAWPMPEEIDDFIRSTPLFSEPLKRFLLGDPEKCILIDAAWLHSFYEKTSLWAESKQWLYYDSLFINDPQLTGRPVVTPLELP